MSADSESSPERRPRAWIPFLALLPLLLLMIADAVMATLATRTDPGLVADAPRRVGLARIAPEMALAAEISLAARSGGYEIAVWLRLPDGTLASDAAVEGRLERTTHAGADRPLVFARAGDGVWTATVVPPDQGAWQVTVAARDAAGRSALAIARLLP
jgi:nitrogen fixation protein FixH